MKSCKKGKVRFYLVGSCLLVLSYFLGYYVHHQNQLVEILAWKVKLQKVYSRVRVGMREEEMIGALSKTGIVADEKVRPTTKSPTYLILVPLGRETSTLKMINYTITGAAPFWGETPSYVVIEIDLEGFVVMVE